MAAEPMSEMLNGILEALPNPVFVKDEGHRWVLLNDSFCRFIGHERELLLGSSDYDFFPKEQADVFHKKDDEVFASGGRRFRQRARSMRGDVASLASTKAGSEVRR